MTATGSGPDPARVVSLDDLARELSLLRSRAARGSRSARVSVEDLAVRVGEPKSTVHAYLTGRRLAPAQLLDRIVIALGTTPAEQREWAEAWYRVSAYRQAVGRVTAAGQPADQVPRQLPLPIADFTGRGAELAELDAVCRAGVGVISAVTGTAGVGKTALAVHWAHTRHQLFPDGQLYVDLRGFDPDPALQPSQVLARLLRALGQPATDIPRELDERAALYRSLLTGRRVLIVLDNARDAEQVRALLPGSASCAVLVTSRDSLTGLVTRHGARRMELGLLPLADAVNLLRALVGPRLDEAPGRGTELAEGCARLPLALRIIAELAQSRHGDLADVTAELAAQPLDVLTAGDDRRTGVRAVLSWSYDRLPATAAQAFRVVGRQDAEVSAHRLAQLLGVGLPEAARLLAHLSRLHLIEHGIPDRYGMHRLLRAYAAELVDDVSPLAPVATPLWPTVNRRQFGQPAVGIG